MKKLLIGLVALAAIVGVAIFVLVSNLDKIIKGAIEGIGSELLGVPVALQSVALDLKTGSGQISGLTIANPAGYSAVNAFQMDKIRLALDIGSMRKQPLVIKELTVARPIIELETKQDGSSNLQTLLDNIKKNGERADKTAAEQQPKLNDAATGKPAKLAIKTLSITGVTVNASVPDKKTASVVIPDVVMENVGGAEGFTPAQIGSVIIGDIIGEVLKASLRKEVKKQVDEAAKGMVERLKKKLNE